MKHNSTGPACKKCNDTGMVAIRSRDGSYAFPGHVPDNARGYADADCWYCDSGRPRGFEGYGPIGGEQ